MSASLRASYNSKIHFAREGGRREINCDRMQIRHGAIRQRRPTRSTRAEETTVAATFPLSTNDERVKRAEVERGGEKLKEALWCPPPPPLLELGLDHPIRRDENDAADVATKQGMKRYRRDVIPRFEREENIGWRSIQIRKKKNRITRGEINKGVKSGVDSKRGRLGSSVKHETLNSRDRNRRRDVAIHHRRNEFIFV